MNKYRLLDDGNNISTFETTNTQLSSENHAQINPANPVAKTIPSILDKLPPTNTARSSSVYGPTTRKYESLKYYGNGGY